MPICAGSPRCTGAPCTAGKRDVICTARMASAAASGRIDTTIGPLKAPAAWVGDRGAVHRHVAALLDVADADALGLHRPLEGERAADGEGHEVVAPQRPDVGRLVDQLAFAPDAVARQVGAQVEVGGQRRQRRAAGIADRQHRAGPRVALAEQQEVVRRRRSAGSPGWPAPGRRPGRWCGPRRRRRGTRCRTSAPRAAAPASKLVGTEQRTRAWDPW